MRRTFPVFSILALLATTGLGAPGCATQEVVPAGGESLRVRLEPEEFRRLGPVRGRSCRNVVLSIFVLESPTLLEAELDARTQAPGTDLILDRYVYSGGETVVPGVFTRRCIFVEGVGVALLGVGS